jgi:hypothetical protein
VEKIMDRRQFLIRAGLAAGHLALPRFFDRALAFVENHNEPLIDAPGNAIRILNVRHDDSYVFFLGDPCEMPGEPPTFRAWFIDNGEDVSEEAENWELEPGDLDGPIPEETWFDQWALGDCSMAQGFHYLSRLDLGPQFGTAGIDAAGEIRLQDCPSICSTYRAAETNDLLSISLLQNRLNELGEATQVDVSQIHKGRWES